MTPTTSKPYELRAWPWTSGWDVFRFVGDDAMHKIGTISRSAEDETFSARFGYADEDGHARDALLGTTYPTLRDAFADLIWCAGVVWTAPGAAELDLLRNLKDTD